MSVESESRGYLSPLTVVCSQSGTEGRTAAHKQAQLIRDQERFDGIWNHTKSFDLQHIHLSPLLPF